MKLLTTLLAVLTINLFVAEEVFAAKAPWHTRPYEIISGELKPRCPVLWQYKAGAENDLIVDNDAKITAGTERRLWSDATAKLTGAPVGKTTLVKFKNPITVEKADGLEVWVLGPSGARSAVQFRYTDAAGKEFSLKTNSGSSNWANIPWWGAAINTFPLNTKFPVKVTGIAFNMGAKVKDSTTYFDMLGAFSFEGLPIPDTSKDELPFPTSPAGIRPNGAPDGGKWGVSKQGDAYSFKYEGADGTLEYIYHPQTGTLSDITAVVNGKQTFQPAKSGGLAVRLPRTKFNAQDAVNNKPELLKAELKNDELVTNWRWSRGKHKFEFTLKFSIYKRVLTVTAEAEEPFVEKFDTGYAVGEGIVEPKIFTVSYLNNRWDAPRMLATKDFLMSVYLDWYYTNSADLVEKAPRLGLPGAAVLGANSARLMGGSAYMPRTDKSRNKLYERMYITISPELADILPNIRNPKSPYYDEMAKLVCCTRMYALQGKGDIDNEVAFWQDMASYGAGDIFLRFHGGKFRMPMASNRLNRSLAFNEDVGSDAEARDMVTALKKAVKRVGPYEDNRIMSPLGGDFKYDYMVKWTDGNIMGAWDNSVQCSPASIALLQADFSPKFVEKFGWNACYFDEVTNTPPWGLVNFDVRDPNAGMLRAVLRDYGLSAMKLREYYNGPIWSEGNAMYFWAGMLDIDYGQSNQPKAAPVADFKLTKINPLQCVTGYDLTVASAPLDFLLASQIVFGHTGYLWDGKSNLIGFGQIKKMTPELLRNVLKSYFMMRQLQELYIGQEIKSILYDIDGKLITASEMFKTGAENSGMVQIEYANGLTVWVNRNAEEYWTVNINGEDYELPPNSHAAYKPNVLLQYTAERDGSRVDYSHGPLYTYVDGRGSSTVFPEIQAANAYVIFTQPDGSKKLIPAPFIGEESLGRLDAVGITAQDKAGKKLDLNLNLEVIDNGKGRFTTVKDAFAYELK